MNVQNLQFFDKLGNNLNLEFDSDLSAWVGTIYFTQVSISVFDNQNLFLLEKVGNNYKFPTIAANSFFKFSWEEDINKTELFLYDVVEDITLNENFISTIQYKTISHSDFNTNSNLPLDYRFPMQVNVAFNPSNEQVYERTLLIHYNSTLIAKIGFYGEGEDEEERFNVWLQNFGIKFLREDANILKDYDIKEANPNLESLNQIRKELLVNREEIYPYIGTYKGLINFVNILGYKDVLKVKEYWQNVNTNSSYFNTLNLVDITDYLDDGKIDTLDLVDSNSSIKAGRQFKKTEFLALVYEFTRETGEYDDDGIPLTEETTNFTVNEVFYKLNALTKKLKNEFLPINVKIKDIIGEFLYFQKITINYWTDSTIIYDYSLNESAQVLMYPDIKSSNLLIRDLSPLYRKKIASGIDFGVVRLNDSSQDPYENSQRWTRDQIPGISDYIKSFYTEIRDQRYPDLNHRLSWEYGDDPEKKIGAPIVLSLGLAKFTVFDLRGVKLSDLSSTYAGIDPYWTLENIDYRNFYEINWKITKNAPNPYNFEYRGKVVDLHTLPHFLPSNGEYRITIELYDFCGNISVFSKLIMVSETLTPEIVGFTRLEDKFDYRISNLSNIQLQDFGANPLYFPRVNVLDFEEISNKVNIYKNLLDWNSFYKNRYGMGQNLYDVDIYDEDTDSYVAYTDPLQSNPNKRYWGLGEGDIPIKIKDLRDIQLKSLYWMRLSDLVYLEDFNAGFIISKPAPGKIIKFSLFSEYTIPNYSTLTELAQILTDSDHPGVRLFDYTAVKTAIHASAKYLSREMYHILFSPGAGSPGLSPSPSAGSPGKLNAGLDNYTFFLPKKVHSTRTIDFLKSISPVFDIETLFLLAKTSDVLNGNVQDPQFWVEEKYWKFENDLQKGHLPTAIDQNAFNLTSIKIFKDSFVLPENGIVFFVINNIDGKNEFIWTLRDEPNNKTIIKVRSVPFFVWKFKDIGTYTLSVDVIDSNKTIYKNSVKNIIRVLDKTNYMINTETRLNLRKNKLINN